MPDFLSWPSTADWRLFATSLVAAVVGFGAWLLAVRLLGWVTTSTEWLILVFAVVVFAAIQLAAGYRSVR